MPAIEKAAPDDPAVRAFLEDRSHGLVARAGELVDPMAYPHLVATNEGAVVGVLTYLVADDRCEVLTLHAAEQLTGVGTALLDRIKVVASELGCTTLHVTTTNDNTDALRFYQRRGFRFTELRTGAVDDARRRLKPGIPTTGNHGIPLRDELELAQPLRSPEPRDSQDDEQPR